MASIEDEWLWGWDPTPGIVSVWAEPMGAPSSGGAIAATGALVREEARFRPWVLLDSLDDLAHLGPRLGPDGDAGARVTLSRARGRRARFDSRDAPTTRAALTDGGAPRRRRAAGTARSVTSASSSGDVVLVLPPEEQYLVATGRTYFRDLSFDQLRRLQFDLETTGLDPRARPHLHGRRARSRRQRRRCSRRRARTTPARRS